LEDQQRIWTFPKNLNEPSAFIPTIAVAGATAGLAWGVDASAAHYFRNTAAFNGFNQVFSSTATTAATLAAPAALYGVGWIRKDSKMTSTALLAGEAVANSEILVLIFKPAANRVRPNSLPPHDGFHDTWEAGPRFSA